MAEPKIKPATKKAQIKRAPAKKKAATKRRRSGATNRLPNEAHANRRQKSKPIEPDEVISPAADDGPAENTDPRTFEFTDSDREEVKTMAGYGTPQDQIAVIKRIDVKTLRKHFKEELAVGAAIGNMKIAQTQYSVAVNDKNPTMLIWLGKQRLGQTDKLEGRGFGDNIERQVKFTFVRSAVDKQ